MRYAILAMPSAPVRVPSQRPFAPNVTSISLSVNGKGDNEMIPETGHKSAVIYLTAEKHHGKPQLGGCATSHRLKWGPVPPDGSVGSYRKREGRK